MGNKNNIFKASAVDIRKNCLTDEDMQSLEQELEEEQYDLFIEEQLRIHGLELSNREDEIDHDEWIGSVQHQAA